jgi:hypothetical protein
MEPLATFAAIESLYARVLELTDRQEQCLRAGRLAELQPLLGAKEEALAEAGALLARVKASGEEAWASGARDSLRRVGELLGALVAAEDRCRALAPPPAPSPPPNRVAAAYLASRR